ncbi:hypothetical protein ACIBKY_51230 [Nonomuraea sp. NPDC050394]|uniref:hypothetical protein n=1 Tax=Nonomuraea sp. NPDC050394 TaxID=3364363 RepID=UPI0037969E60
MTAPVYQVGDLVKITYVGRVTKTGTDEPTMVLVEVEGSTGEFFSLMFSSNQPVDQHQLVTSALWPPLQGDVWTGGGLRWFAHAADDDGLGIALTSEIGHRYEDEKGLTQADHLYGPFRLEVPSEARTSQEAGRG